MVSAYIDDVVFVSLNRGIDWKVVMELHMIYLRYVEEEDALNLGNVYSSGGQDTKMKEAEEKARANFRAPRGDPADASGAKMAWDCAFDSDATQICTSFNLKKDHPHTSIVNGKCKYKHVCDKFVLDANGDRVECGATDHCRVACTNPERVDG